MIIIRFDNGKDTWFKVAELSLWHYLPWNWDSCLPRGYGFVQKQMNGIEFDEVFDDLESAIAYCVERNSKHPKVVATIFCPDQLIKFLEESSVSSKDAIQRLEDAGLIK